MEQLPTKLKTVTTPVEKDYVGRELNAQVCASARVVFAVLIACQICGITILRS